MAVCPQRHQLLHVALESAVVALRQKFQAPQPLVRVQLRAKQQWRVAAKHPFQRLQRGIAVGPGLAVADRDLCCVGKAGLQRRTRLALDHRDFVATFEQMPGGAHANDARTQNDNFHTATFTPQFYRAKCEASCFQLKEKLNS